MSLKLNGTGTILGLREKGIPSADSVGFIQDGVGTAERTVQDKLRDFVSVKDFGAVGDGVADDTAAIHAAIASIPAAGGTVQFPVGVYAISDTIFINKNRVMLVGDGCNYLFQSGPYSGGVAFKWIGNAGSTMIYIKPPSGLYIYGVQIHNVSLDGGGIAGYGILIEGLNQGHISNINIRSCTSAALKTQGVLGVVVNNYVANNRFDSIWITQLNSSDGDGVILGGGDVANITTTVNTFTNLHIYHHQDNDGLVLARADTNQFINLRVIGSAAGGSGKAIRFCAVPSNAEVYGNYFYGVAVTKSGILSEGTDVAARPAHNNWAFGILYEPGTPLPVEGPGATFRRFVGRDASGLGLKRDGGVEGIVLANGVQFMGKNTSGGEFGLFQCNSSNELQIFPALRCSAALNMQDGPSVNFGYSNGNRIGGDASQKIGFWGAAPIIQPSTVGTTSGFTVGTGSGVLSGSTFTGGMGTKAYTIGDIVKALKSAGIMASS